MYRTGFTAAADHFHGTARRRGFAALFFLAAAAGLLMPCAQAMTNVGGNYTTNTTWAAADTPHHMVSGVTVASGVTLTIEPGVTVYIDAAKDMIVQGCQGTGTFTRLVNPNCYECHRLVNPKSSSLFLRVDVCCIPLFP